MKRWLIVALVTVLALTLIMVLEPWAPTEVTPPSEEGVTPPEEEALPPEEEEEVTPPAEEEEETLPPPPSKPHFISDDGRIEFALDNVDRTKVWPVELRDRHTPKEGHDFIVVHVTIVRITDGHVASASGSTLVDDEGGEYQGYRGLQYSWECPFLTGPYEVLEGCEGTFIYEVPENVELAKLRLAYLFFESWSESGQRQSEEERYIDIILL